MKNTAIQGSQEPDPGIPPEDSIAFRTPVFTVTSEINHVSCSNKNRMHLQPFSSPWSPATFFAFFDSPKFPLKFFQYNPVQRLLEQPIVTHLFTR